MKTRTFTLIIGYEHGTFTKSTIDILPSSVKVIQNISDDQISKNLQLIEYCGCIYVAKGGDLNMDDFIFGNVTLYTCEMMISYLSVRGSKYNDFTSFIKSTMRISKLDRLGV